MSDQVYIVVAIAADTLKSAQALDHDRDLRPPVDGDGTAESPLYDPYVAGFAGGVLDAELLTRSSGFSRKGPRSATTRKGSSHG